MILALPWTAWLLLLASGGIGLALALAFYFTHRNPRSSTIRRLSRDG